MTRTPLNAIRRHVAIVLYDGFTALDAVGPYEVLVSLPDTHVHFVSDIRGPVLADTGQLALVATATWEELPNPAIILIPGGGTGLTKATQNHRLLGWHSRRMSPRNGRPRFARESFY